LVILLLPAIAGAGQFTVDSVVFSGQASGHAITQGRNSVNGTTLAADGTALDIPSSSAGFALTSYVDRTTDAWAHADPTTCTMTLTVAWHPDSGQTLTSDPPPSPVCLILRLTCSGTYDVQVEETGTVSGMVKLTVNGTQIAESVQTASGADARVRYTSTAGPIYSVLTRSVPPSGVITLDPITISAETKVSYAGRPRAYHGFSSTATVTPTVTPVLLSVDGTTRNTADGSLNVMIGQGCTASVSAGQYTLSNHNWTIGGNIFKSYEAHGPVDGGCATVCPVTEVDLAQPTVRYSYTADGPGSEPDTAYVVVTVDVSDGGIAIGQADPSLSIKVWPPICVSATYPGHTFVLRALDCTPFLEAGNRDANPEGEIGIRFTVSVTQPDWVEQYLACGQGEWQFVQTMQPMRSRTIAR
jgi:hypothetical protein